MCGQLPIFRTATSGLTVLAAVGSIAVWPQHQAIAQAIQATSGSSASITSGPEQIVIDRSASTSTTVGDVTTKKSISVTETLDAKGNSIGNGIARDKDPMPSLSIPIGLPGTAAANFDSLGKNNSPNFGSWNSQSVKSLPNFTISNPALPSVADR